MAMGEQLLYTSLFFRLLSLMRMPKRLKLNTLLGITWFCVVSDGGGGVVGVDVWFVN
jgi:hypothetical protein